MRAALFIFLNEKKDNVIFSVFLFHGYNVYFYFFKAIDYRVSLNVFSYFLHCLSSSALLILFVFFIFMAFLIFGCCLIFE